MTWFSLFNKDLPFNLFSIWSEFMLYLFSDTLDVVIFVP